MTYLLPPALAYQKKPAAHGAPETACVTDNKPPHKRYYRHRPRPTRHKPANARESTIASRLSAPGQRPPNNWRGYKALRPPPANNHSTSNKARAPHAVPRRHKACPTFSRPPSPISKSQLRTGPPGRHASLTTNANTVPSPARPSERYESPAHFISKGDCATPRVPQNAPWKIRLLSNHSVPF